MLGHCNLQAKSFNINTMYHIVKKNILEHYIVYFYMHTCTNKMKSIFHCIDSAKFYFDIKNMVDIQKIRLWLSNACKRKKKAH